SRRYNDSEVSRMALYNLLAENPNNAGLRDSLALIYFESQMYASAALVAQEVANFVPDDMLATEIAAISFENLGFKNKAFKFYERLYLNNTDDIGRLYKMGFLQMDLKLFEEALSSAELLTNHKLAEGTALVFPTEKSEGQEVNMKLSALRLKAMIEVARGNKEVAKEYYQNILKVKPDFELAKKELAALN
ncbi:MAG: hypothetical protein RIF46_08160, partial [Cyclobacteriaceae bacterium]